MIPITFFSFDWGYCYFVYLDRKYSYYRTLPHITKDCPLFVTFTTFKRWCLPEAARDIVFRCCRELHNTHIDLLTLVVMPDHVHLLFTPLRNPEGWSWSLPQILRLIKGRSAHFINKALERRGPVWQDEFFDHVLRTNESLAEKAEYIRQNPIRAGLAHSPAEYRWLWWQQGQK